MTEDRVPYVSENDKPAPMSMVERVARALCEIDHLHLGGPDAQTLVPGTPNWSFHVSAARAAIAAMREPTPEMTRSLGWDREEWEIAIDAALKGQ